MVTDFLLPPAVDDGSGRDLIVVVDEDHLTGTCTVRVYDRVSGMSASERSVPLDEGSIEAATTRIAKQLPNTLNT